MKHSRPIKRYEWHLPYSKVHNAFLVNYYHKDSEHKNIKYSLGAYFTKEDAADAFNYLTQDIYQAHAYDIDFRFLTYRIQHTGSNKMAITDFDILAGIVDRHNYNLPPPQKPVTFSQRAEFQRNWLKIATLNPRLRAISPGLDW